MNNYFTQGQQARLSQLEQMQGYGQKSNVIYSLVNGIDSARSFMLMPGEVGLLFDSQSSEFYKKSVDAMGIMSLKKYRYTEVEVPAVCTPDIAGGDAALDKRMENIETALSELLAGMKKDTASKETKNDASAK